MSSQSFENGPPPSGQGQFMGTRFSPNDEELSSISSQPSTHQQSDDDDASTSQAHDHAQNYSSHRFSSPDDYTDERPNRWQGDRKLWYSLTSTERRIVVSVEKTAASDLSRHLFNAFALRMIAKQSEEKIWAPRPAWTAWPLAPKVVPRLQEETMAINPDSRHQPLTSRQELEEVLIGRVTKEARHRVLYKMQVERYENELLVARNEELGPGSGSGSSNADVEDEDAEVQDDKPRLDKPRLDESDSDTDSSSDEEPLAGSRVSCRVQNKADAKVAAAEAEELSFPLAVPSTDSDIDSAILRPSVRHIQASFDKLLMSLHRSRQNIRASARRRSRSGTSSSPASSHSSLSRKSSRGGTSSPFPKRHRSDSFEEESEPETKATQRRRVRQRDWTDVLGMASITQSFDPLVIERSRARLSSILGDDMTRIP